MTQIAAGVTASADALTFSEAARLQLTNAEGCACAMRCEMTAPDGDCSLTLKGRAFHSSPVTTADRCFALPSLIFRKHLFIIQPSSTSQPCVSASLGR